MMTSCRVCVTPAVRHSISPAKFVTQLVSDTGMRESHGLPGRRVIATELVRGRRIGSITQTAAAGLPPSRIGQEAQMCVFANATDAGGVRRNVSQDGGVGIAAVESK